MKELKKQHLEMLQLLESIEVMLKNGDSIHPDSVIRGAIQTAIGMDINLNNEKMEKEKSVVEFLIEQLEEEDSKIARLIGLKKYNEIIKKANEIFEQQIIKAAESAYEDMFSSDGTEYGEDYYNKTFKSE